MSPGEYASLESASLPVDEVRSATVTVCRAQISQLRAKGEALTSLASDLVAFAAFADLEDAFEPLDVVVIQLASDVEHEVQRRHDMAPGK
jgi:hypothetical protein